jgi:pimeloyl-ACP methyl ester carboxylesterase
MKQQKLTIAGVPAILYGSRSRRVYLYIHGKNGCKEEAERFANTACACGWQVLAIDLPEHGSRKNGPEKLVPWVVIPELQAVYARMQPVWPHIRLYGVSIGAWFAMQALQAEKLEKALFVSPVVDMETLITNMMQGTNVTEAQLQAAGKIPTSFGETLSWPYLCWVREYPLQWHTPTQVLYGDKDALTSRAVMERFRQESGARLTIMEGGEHWFHTPLQLAVMQSWEEENL